MRRREHSAPPRPPPLGRPHAVCAARAAPRAPRANLPGFLCSQASLVSCLNALHLCLGSGRREACGMQRSSPRELAATHTCQSRAVGGLHRLNARPAGAAAAHSLGFRPAGRSCGTMHHRGGRRQGPHATTTNVCPFVSRRHHHACPPAGAAAGRPHWLQHPVGRASCVIENETGKTASSSSERAKHCRGPPGRLQRYRRRQQARARSSPHRRAFVSSPAAAAAWLASSAAIDASYAAASCW